MQQSRISLRCLEIIQPIGTFYIGVIDAQSLIRISYTDVRRISERDVERYLGIQRPLSPKRVDEIKSYVNTVDATFPTGVILAIASEDVEFDSDIGEMRIFDLPDVAKIIDGQHRIAGLQDFSDEFQINVVIFLDMDLEDQAMVFATINLAQTKVSKSLAIDLYEYTKSRSPIKTCHNIARLMNYKQGSPLFDRIKILGSATSPYQPLTQATFVEALVRLISGNAQNALKDRDLIKRGKKLNRTIEIDNKLVFRNLFINEKDEIIAKIVWNYFQAIEDRWPIAWAGLDVRGNVLPRTNGFRALMRFLPLMYTWLEGPDTIPTVGQFMEVLYKFPFKDGEFTTENYPPGTSGETKLFRQLDLSLQKINQLSIF